MKHEKKFLSFVLAIITIVCTMPFAYAEDSTYEIGDIVQFGSYPQSKSSSGTYQTEPIKWRILSISGDTALLLSDKILDCRQYHSSWVDITWEKSQIRSWLNSTFYNKAFNEEEKNHILLSNIKNEDNPTYNIDAGNDTTDKIFLLSLQESINSGYGFLSNINEHSSRIASATDYAINNGVLIRGDNNVADWWLRTPGSDASRACVATYKGYTHPGGAGVAFSNDGVRPAVRVDLNAVKENNTESENTNVTVSISEDNVDAYIGVDISICVSVRCEEGNISDYPLLSTVDSNIVSFVSQSVLTSSDGKTATYLVRLMPNAAGSCIFTASAGGSSDSCTITVKEPEIETKLTAGMSLTPSTINYYSKNNVDFNEITVNCRITNTISSYNGDISEIKDDEEYDAFVASVKFDLSDTNYVTIDGGSSVTVPVNKTLKAGEGTVVRKTIKVKDKIKLNDDVECANVTVTATVSAASDGNSKTLTPSRQITINNKNYVVKQEEERSKNAENAYDEFEDLLKNKENCMVLGPSANYIFTEEERKEIAEILFMQMLLQTIPEESLVEKIKERLDDVIYDDVTGEMDEDFKESLDKLLNDYDLDVDVYSKCAESSIIISTKKYGDVKITAKTSVNKTNLSDKEIASWGQVTYTYEGENLPAGVTNYDQGYMSSVDVDGFVEAAQEVVLDEIEEMYNYIYGDDLNEVADMLFGQAGKKIIQAGGYDSASNMVYEAAAYPLKIFCAKCPVNIFVYDSENNLCASVENDVVTHTSDKAQISVYGDEKTVKLYDDTYQIVAEPTGNGVMNVTIEEYANSRGLIKTINMNDIPLEFGKNYTSTVDMEIIGDINRYALTSENDNTEILPDEVINNLHYHIDKNSDNFCDICLNKFAEEVVEPEYNYAFYIQEPSRTEIRNKDGIVLHANIEGNVPAGSYVKWESSNGNFDKSADGSNLKIIAKNKGWTTFTAILCDADGNELARDTVEMYSKSGFFDKIGGFFRSLFGTTKIYDN